MKRLIHSTNEIFSIELDEVVSIVFADDIDSYRPKDIISSVLAGTKMNYNSLTREQLLQLPKRELEGIHDVDVLRKLNYNELTLQQQRDVAQANMINFNSSISVVKEALNKLKQCHRFYVWGTDKNNALVDYIYDQGGEIQLKDIRKIIHSLHVKDYSESTLSHIDTNWNSLLMVFEYTGSYTFQNSDDSDTAVTVDNLDIYIKIDVDTSTKKGYAVISFHKPEMKMKHPYSDYPIDKE